MKIIRLGKNDIEKKKVTRSLYESCFPYDSKELVDYYYDSLIKRNEIYIIEENNKIISMIHLNPYLYYVSGKIVTIHYLFAIATDNAYRKRGYMKLLLNETIEYLKSINEPFCYLQPEDLNLENIYEKFGFFVLCNYTFDKFSNDSYDVFPVRDSEFIKLMEKEQYFLSKDPPEYIKTLRQRKIMVRVLDDNIDIEKLKQKKAYFCNEI